MGMTIARCFRFEGRVQGVGFRYSTKQIAMGFDITGWVENLDDGAVRLFVQGEEAEVAHFLDSIRDGHLGGLIRNRVEEPARPDASVPGFVIRR